VVITTLVKQWIQAKGQIVAVLLVEVLVAGSLQRQVA
jgi:hypothetical protein